MIEPHWLVRRDLVLHSGSKSFFKIECEALTEEELETFALIISKKFTFGSVVGIPRGGLPIAEALQKYCTKYFFIRLIVDDVLTTGESFNPYLTSIADIGVVLFARGKCPDGVYPVFQLW